MAPIFQSTRPLRGATGRHDHRLHHHRISIHAPLAGRDLGYTVSSAFSIISIHAPLAGRDCTQCLDRLGHTDFNPRAPCGARPGGGRPVDSDTDFNPRAPCGARRFRLWQSPRRRYFNPRAPCGARPGATMGALGRSSFQSTRPLRGATEGGRGWTSGQVFQSTRPLRGATGRRRSPAPTWPHFNPRAPCGARHVRHVRPVATLPISIHAPLAGRDSYTYPILCVIRNFNPRAPCGARRTRPQRRPSRAYFNPRAPCGARPGTLAHCIVEAEFQSTRPLRGATIAAMSSASI